MSSGTTSLNMVGVSFMSNPSLSSRYSSHLMSSNLICPTTLNFTKPNCVVMATTGEPLKVLSSLSVRQGFTRCSGRLFAMDHISNTEEAFLSNLVDVLPPGTIVRTHCHPSDLSSRILDYIVDLSHVISSPTQFNTVLVAVQLDGGRLGWGVYSSNQYKEVISRPGDGEARPEFLLNFNRAELKLAEAVQILGTPEHDNIFGSDLLAVDVGAAPGGWTGYLVGYNSRVGVVAIDPAELSPDIAALDRVQHLKAKAEDVVKSGKLEAAATPLAGSDWRQKFRLLVCDANLDVRDTVRELVVPVADLLAPDGCLILTLKLGRRVGVDGVKRKINQATELLETAGFGSIKVSWLFGNSKNERTMFAVKI